MLVSTEAEVRYTVLAHQCIQRHIMIASRDMRQLLTAVRDAHQQRSMPLLAQPAERKQTIVVPGARSQACAARIEAEQRHEYHRQRTGGNVPAVGGFRNAVSIAR